MSRYCEICNKEVDPVTSPDPYGDERDTGRTFYLVCPYCRGVVMPKTIKDNMEKKKRKK